jgi:RNA polymerase sigma-70 factor (ECF subfamily)
MSPYFDRRKDDDAPIGCAEDVRGGIERMLPRLWRFCIVLAKDRGAAEELAQATCLRALQREHQFQPGTRLDSWLYRIAQTIWFNERRAVNVRGPVGEVGPEDVELVDQSVGAELNLYHKQVLSAVMALPESQRIAVVLVYVEGYSYKEAADHVGVPIGTIMSRLAAARMRLATLKEDVTERRAARAQHG